MITEGERKPPLPSVPVFTEEAFMWERLAGNTHWKVWCAVLDIKTETIFCKTDVYFRER